MSIDYYIFDFDGPPPPDEIMTATGYKSVPMGTIATVQAKISDHVPGIEWRPGDDVVGYVADHGYLIEFTFSPDEDGLVYCIGVHPYGVADAEPVMSRFCVPHGWYVHNPQGGRWMEPLQLAELAEGLGRDVR